MDFTERKWALGGGPGEPPAISPNFSQGVRVGPMIFTSGQAALNEQGELVGANDIRAQTKKTLENIGAVLKSLGASYSDVVKTTVWVKSYDDYAGMNEVYATFFDEPRPPRATVKSDLVPMFDDGFLVEIEAVAIVSD
jgi:2-iminobutanoate/2-iminopropanoate deaminase